MTPDSNRDQKLSRRKFFQYSALAGGAFMVPSLVACGGSDDKAKGDKAKGSSTSGPVTGTITVASVTNPVMIDLQALTKSVFEKQNPGVKVQFVTLPETDLRAKVTRDIATNGGEFDAMMLGPYDIVQWAKQGWIQSLTEYATDPAYKIDDIIPTTRSFFTYEDEFYATPIYAESQNLMYRKDAFEKAGVQLGESPTWSETIAAAAKLNNVAIGGKKLAGLAMRGAAGEVLVPLQPMIHTYGGRIVDENWAPTLTEPEAASAITDYIKMTQANGQKGIGNAGFTDVLTTMGQGDAAMWVDATVASQTLENPDNSSVAGKLGYAMSPHNVTDFGGAYWGWGICMVNTSKKKDLTWKYLSWATGPDYPKIVADAKGWTSVAPGVRQSVYDNPEYVKATPNAQITIDSIKLAGSAKIVLKPTAPGRPVAYFDYPNWWDVMLKFTAPISSAIAKKSDPAAAVKAANDALGQALKQSGYWKG